MVGSKRKTNKVQESLDKTIERSRGLYSEYEKLVKIQERDEQKRLRTEFNSKAYQAQDHELNYNVTTCINSAFQGQAFKIKKEYGDLKSKK